MPRCVTRCLAAVSALFLVVSCKSSPTTSEQPPAVATVEVTPSSATLAIGESRALSATPRSDNGGALSGRSISWQSDNGAVASVDAQGVVHGVAGGTAGVTATSEGKVGHASITVNHPVPTLTAISPTSATAGGTAFTLTLTGSNFVTGVEVRWNGTARTTTRVSATQLTAAIGVSDIATAGSASVTVVNPTPGGGASAALAFTINPGLPADNPLPVLASIQPSGVIAGSGMLTLTVNGSAFVATSVVRWNGSPRTTTFVSASQLTASISASDVATAGSASVTVFTPSPGGGTSASASFTIAAPVSASLAGGAQHFCAIKPNGTAWCWGDATNGKLGNGASGSLTPQQSYAAVPVAVSGGRSFKQIAAGDAATCAIALAGDAWCWGAGDELGNGSGSTAFVPGMVSGGLQFSAISMRGRTACALTTLGQAWCWGNGASGALGNGASANSAVPVAVSGGHTFTAISTGAGHSCALDQGGAAWCWGTGGNGQLGVVGSSAVPVAVSGGHLFLSIEAGDAETCGIVAGNQVWCWGIFHDPSPEMPKLMGYAPLFQSLTMGNNQYCGVSTTNQAYCWGQNQLGETGSNSRGANIANPVAVSGGLAFRRVVVNRVHTACGLTTSDALYCWGSSGGTGLLGNGTIAWAPVPVATNGGIAFQVLAAGDFETCGGTATNLVYCWGRVGYSLDQSVPYLSSPAIFLTGVPLTSLSGGSSHFCGVSTGGLGVCYGDGASGQLGGGSNVAYSAVALVVSGGLAFQSVSTGQYTTCGATLTNALYCWGSGSLGQSPTSNVPVLVAGTSAAQVAGNALHRCSLAPDGTASCWGNNSSGQVGDGSTTTRSSPTVVSTALKFSAIALGLTHTCAIATGGAAYCWGSGSRLGNGSTSNRSTPTAVSGGLQFTAIAAGAFHTCALTATGATYCWGTGGKGVLGDNDQTASALAPQLVNVPNLVSISAYDDHTCGLTAAGAAWCWGGNLYGQLGIGTTGFSVVPVSVNW